jgi:Fe-S cluster assembly scaffold protein SufB
MPDLQPMTMALRMVGEDPLAVLGPDSAHLVAYGHQLASIQSVPGVTVLATNEKGVIHARVIVAEGRQIAQPVHLCFGMFERFGNQVVELDVTLEPRSSATLWSHCLFTEVEEATHAMTARIEIQADASLAYQEEHYHGNSGGIEVVPRATVKVGSRARYTADFALVQGRVGTLDIDYRVDVAEHAVAELTSKVYGFGTDSILIREQVNLNGEGARGLVKTRVAAREHATAVVIGVTHGNAAGARGHVDCTEIVRDQAVVSAIPEVKVTHPQAKVTHEAAIGSVDSKQLETLMAHGLDPESAVDLIIRGMLT